MSFVSAANRTPHPHFPLTCLYQCIHATHVPVACVCAAYVHVCVRVCLCVLWSKWMCIFVKFVCPVVACCHYSRLCTCLGLLKQGGRLQISIIIIIIVFSRSHQFCCLSGVEVHSRPDQLRRSRDWWLGSPLPHEHPQWLLQAWSDGWRVLVQPQQHLPPDSYNFWPQCSYLNWTLVWIYLNLTLVWIYLNLMLVWMSAVCIFSCLREWY